MSKYIRPLFWIFLAAASIFFVHLGAASLWDEDETLYASCAREMMQRGDWVVPVFNGQLFPDKPPLMFWLMMGGFKLFGTNEFGARFFSAVLGLGTAWLTYFLGRRLFNSRVGLWAGLITASTIIFTVSARAATVDSALVFVTTLAMLCFVEWIGQNGQGTADSGQGRVDGGQWAVGSDASAKQRLRVEKSPQQFAICNLQLTICNQNIFRYVFVLLFYVSLGLAVLAKGPVGFLLPMASLGLFLMFVNARQNDESNAVPADSGWKTRWHGLRQFFSPGNFLKSLWQLRPVTGVVVVLAVALPWYILVGMRTDGQWLDLFFGKFNFRPFTQPILGHGGPMWYYIPAVFVGFFPWSVFLGPVGIAVMQRIRERHPWGNSYLLAACWFGASFVFWSICSTKLPHYVLPAYPALALMTAGFLEAWIADPFRVNRLWITNAWFATMAVGVGMAVAIPFVARVYLPGEEWLGLIGLILVLGGGLSWYFARHKQRERAIIAFAACSAAFLTAMFGFAAIRVDRHQNAKPLIAAIHRDCHDAPTVCSYRFFRQSMVYYAGGPIARYESADQLESLLDGPKPVYILTLDQYVAELEHEHPGELREFTRQRRFLAADDMVVLEKIPPGELPATAVRPTPLKRQ
jgi:4-amino-4-deoxy-L-arabinose transferase-like glycosyltransferase